MLATAQFTISKINDGADGSDAYSVILGNESHVFAGNSQHALATTAKCDVIAYKGDTKVNTKVGTISGMPNGMTCIVNNNNTTDTVITITVTTNMVTKNGVLLIPINVDNKVNVTKYFTYSLSLEGKGIEKTETEYYVSTSKTTQTGGAWSTDSPTWSYGKYIWVRIKTTYTDGTIDYSTPMCDSSWEAINELNIGGTNLVDGTREDYWWYSPSNSNNQSCDWDIIYWKDYSLSVGDKVCISFDFSWEGMDNLPDNFSITWQNYGTMTEDSSSFWGTTLSQAIGNVTNVTNLVKSIASGSYHYSLVYTITENDLKKNYEKLRVRVNYSNGTGKLGVRRLKIERGTVPTDWSPSPKDVQQQIDKVMNELSDLASDSKLTPNEKQQVYKEWLEINSEYSKYISQSGDLSLSTTDYTNAYNSLNTYLNNSTNGLLKNMNETSDIVFADFTNKFKAYYDAKTDILSSIETAKAQQAMNNIKVGGTNLYTGTKRFSGSDWYNKVSYSTKSEKYKDFTVLHRSGIWNGLYQNIEVKSGESYTFSAYVKCNSTANLQIYVVASSTPISTPGYATIGNTGTEWARISKTFKITSDGTMKLRLENSVDSGEFDICAIKVERGNIATDWSPSPLDSEYELENLEISTKNLILTSGNYKVSSIIKWVADNTTDWTMSKNDGYLKFIKNTTANAKWINIPLSQKLIKGQEYIYKAKIKTNVDKNCAIYAGNSSRATFKLFNFSTTANDWCYIENVFTFNGNDNTFDELFLTSTEFNAIGEEVSFEWSLLIKGHKVGDWTPAPEDFSDQIETVVTKTSELEQDLDSFKVTVSKTYATTNGVEEIKTTLESSIEANAEQIELKVAKDDIISSINQSAESIQISANKVNLDGYVTFTNLETEGETNIHGGNIDTDTLFARDITATGTISGATLIGGVIKSENFTENTEDMYDRNGNLNQKYNVYQGILIDLNNMVFKTPQITIGENYIKNNGYIVNGTLAQKSSTTSEGIGIEYGSISNGLSNWLNATASFASGSDNIVNVSNSMVQSNFVRSLKTEYVSKDGINITFTFPNPISGLSQPTTYADITIGVKCDVYENTSLLKSSEYWNKNIQMLQCSSVSSKSITFKFLSSYTYDTKYKAYLDDYDYIEFELTYTEFLTILMKDTLKKSDDLYNYEFSLCGFQLNIYKEMSSAKNIVLLGRNLKSITSDQVVCGYWNNTDNNAIFAVGNGTNYGRHDALWVDRDEGNVWCNALRLTNESAYGIMQQAGDGSFKTLITIGGSNMKDYFICNSAPVDDDCTLNIGNYGLRAIYFRTLYTRFLKGDVALSQGAYFKSITTNNTSYNLIGLASNGTVYIANSSPVLNSSGNYGNIVLGNESFPNMYVNAKRIRFGYNNNYIELKEGLFRPTQTGIDLGSSATAGRFKDAYFSGKIYCPTTTIQTSDLKAKKYFSSIDDELATTLIMGLYPAVFKFKKEENSHKGERWHSGFGAQPTSELCSTLSKQLDICEAHVVNEDGTWSDYNPNTMSDIDDSRLAWGMDYTGIIAPHVKVTQIHNRKISMLEESYNKQKEEMEDLKKELKELRKLITQ